MARAKQILFSVLWVGGVGIPAAVLALVYLQWFPNPWLPLLTIVLLPAVFGWLLSDALTTRGNVALATSVSVAAWLTVAYAAWQWKLYFTSVANIEVLRSHRRVLDEYFQLHGHFPEALSGVERADIVIPNLYGIDSWGNQLFYEGRPRAYILASLGRDAARDGVDYWKERESSDFTSVCDDYAADCVASDRGIHRACGK